MVELFSYIISNIDIDFTRNNYQFIKAMIKYNSKNIVKYIIKDSTFVTNDMKAIAKIYCAENSHNEAAILLLDESKKKRNTFR